MGSASIDYRLRRRAVLRDLQAGRLRSEEVCDASPYLLSAARFHGERTDDRCPVCRRENLTHVHYIYGDELKQSAGQARSLRELAGLVDTANEIQVYVVEVCRGCRWNHLVEQFLLGRKARESELPAVTPGAAAFDTIRDTSGGYRPSSGTRHGRGVSR